MKNNILITGGTGMIGRYLTEMLVDKGDYDTIIIAALDNPTDIPSGKRIVYSNIDLRDRGECESLFRHWQPRTVYHLAGVKGSPKVAAEQPDRFMVPMMQFNTNVMECAKNFDVDWLLYTSSMGIYAPKAMSFEDDDWSTGTPYPSKNDWYAGWAKRVGEIQLQAYAVSGWKRWSIIRPANVYGRYDNFDPASCMVIPATIRKVLEADKYIEAFGDGSNIRDFVHAADVAKQMKFMVDNKLNTILNSSSGTGITIKELIMKTMKAANRDLPIRWMGGPSGDAARVGSNQKAKNEGFSPCVSLETGLKDTIEWFKNNKDFKRYNSFQETVNASK